MTPRYLQTVERYIRTRTLEHCGGLPDGTWSANPVCGLQEVQRRYPRTNPVWFSEDHILCDAILKRIHQTGRGFLSDEDVEDCFAEVVEDFSGKRKVLSYMEKTLRKQLLSHRKTPFSQLRWIMGIRAAQVVYDLLWHRMKWDQDFGLSQANIEKPSHITMLARTGYLKDILQAWLQVSAQNRSVGGHALVRRVKAAEVLLADPCVSTSRLGLALGGTPVTGVKYMRLFKQFARGFVLDGAELTRTACLAQECACMTQGWGDLDKGDAGLPLPLGAKDTTVLIRWLQRESDRVYAQESVSSGSVPEDIEVVPHHLKRKKKKSPPKSTPSRKVLPEGLAGIGIKDLRQMVLDMQGLTPVAQKLGVSTKLLWRHLVVEGAFEGVIVAE